MKDLNCLFLLPKSCEIPWLIHLLCISQIILHLKYVCTKTVYHNLVCMESMTFSFIGANSYHLLIIVSWLVLAKFLFNRYKTEGSQKLEPIEEVTIEVGAIIANASICCSRIYETIHASFLFQINEEHVGLVMEALSHRRGEVVDMGSVPGHVGRTRLSLTCPSRLACLLHPLVLLILLMYSLFCSSVRLDRFFYSFLSIITYWGK